MRLQDRLLLKSIFSKYCYIKVHTILDLVSLYNEIKKSDKRVFKIIDKHRNAFINLFDLDDISKKLVYKLEVAKYLDSREHVYFDDTFYITSKYKSYPKIPFPYYKEIDIDDLAIKYDLTKIEKRKVKLFNTHYTKYFLSPTGDDVDIQRYLDSLWCIPERNIILFCNGWRRLVKGKNKNEIYVVL